MTDALRRIDKVRQIRRAIGLTIGAAIYSAGLNLFLIPNHVIDGGVTGISLLIQALTGIPFSVLIVLPRLGRGSYAVAEGMGFEPMNLSRS